MYQKVYYSQLLHTALYITYNTNPPYFSDKSIKQHMSMLVGDGNRPFHYSDLATQDNKHCAH